MRLQLALNVTDLQSAIEYYERLFGVEAAKLKPGYANFEISEPPLKLVLFETANADDRLSHLGVEVFDNDAVIAAADRQSRAGLDLTLSEDQGCCYAKQNKAVSYAPDGTMWEWYVKTEDLDGFSSNPPTSNSALPAKPVTGCC